MVLWCKRHQCYIKALKYSRHFLKLITISLLSISRSKLNIASVVIKVELFLSKCVNYLLEFIRQSPWITWNKHSANSIEYVWIHLWTGKCCFDINLIAKWGKDDKYSVVRIRISKLQTNDKQLWYTYILHSYITTYTYSNTV